MAPLFSLVALAVWLGLNALAAASVDNKTYEYIVVGSGPGGAPLASNLARAGHSVLLLEAGDDQTENVRVNNTSKRETADQNFTAQCLSMGELQCCRQ
jgi:choline dehydrogenase